MELSAPLPSRAGTSEAVQSSHVMERDESVPALQAFDGVDERPNAIVASARREFTSAFGDLARGKRNWQLAAFVLGAIGVLQGLINYRLAALAHPVPYII